MQWINQPEEWSPCQNCAPALQHDTGILLDMLDQHVKQRNTIHAQPTFMAEILDRFRTEVKYAAFDHPELLKDLLPPSLFVPFMQTNMDFVAEMTNHQGFRNMLVRLFTGTSGNGSPEPVPQQPQNSLSDESVPWVRQDITRSFLLEFCESDPSLFTQVLCDQELLRCV
jgi:hypothetical protein